LKETYGYKSLEKAREIKQLLDQLLSSLSKGGSKEEEIESLMKAISASVAHLISSYKAKFDPSSSNYQTVLEAAKNVSHSTQNLLSIIKDLSQKEVKKQNQPNSSCFKNELEAYAKISKLEKELYSARQELFTSRKSKYQ